MSKVRMITGMVLYKLLKGEVKKKAAKPKPDRRLLLIGQDKRVLAPQANGSNYTLRNKIVKG